MKLNLVTLAFNNPEQVRRTLASVALQRVGPDRHVVVDGSSAQFSPGIRKFAEKAGAEYFWREPRGVYPAMNEALNEVSSDSFVWFLNSSDWLASPESIATARQALKKDFHWAVGGLHRYRDNKVSFHPSPREGKAFVYALRSGRIGFPHPSTIMSKASIDRCGGFDEAYQIAGDYALAVRFAAEFGEPQMIPEVLSIHDPTGLTSRNKVLHVREKSRARRESGGTIRSELVALGAIIRAAIMPFPKVMEKEILDRKLPGFSTANVHADWPDACLPTLDSWGE